METQVKEKRILSEGHIKGSWRLTYKLTNNLGPGGFSGRMIGPYRHPVTGENRILFNSAGVQQLGYFCENTTEHFHPEKNPDHLRTVDWLAGHPEVGIENEHCNLPKELLSQKINNPRFKLVNLDHQDVVDLEEEDFIDKLVGLISLDNGKNAIGIDKLRYVLSRLNLEYREVKFVNDPNIEKQKLRKRLKTFVRSSFDNAKAVSKVLDNVEEAKIVFEIKEMIRLNILTVSGSGMYMYQGNPIGISYESLKAHFHNHPEFYAQLTSKLYEELKS